MASINYGAKEISVKVVYYGPGLSGKTTNLQVIHQKVPKDNKSNMVSLATETDRTLFFDFLPLDLGKIKGFATKFQLYTVPGQVYYNATRKLVLRGVDGVVFVADSSPTKIDENLESFQNLLDNLAEYGYKRETVPMVIQYNKRDLPDALPIEQLHSSLNKYNLPWSEAVAVKGQGVFDTLKVIGKIVIDELNKKYSRPSSPLRSAGSAAQARPATPPPSRPAPPPPPRPRTAPPQQQQQSRPAPPPPPPPPAQKRPAAPPPPPPPQPRQAPPPPPSQESTPSFEDPFMDPSTQDHGQQPSTGGASQGYENSSFNLEDQPQQQQTPPPQEQNQSGGDYYDHNSISLEPMDNSAANSTGPGTGSAPGQPAQNTNSGAQDNKSELDLEIERYQREIEEKQGLVGSPQPEAPQQGYSQQPYTGQDNGQAPQPQYGQDQGFYGAGNEQVNAEDTQSSFDPGYADQNQQAYQPPQQNNAEEYGVYDLDSLQGGSYGQPGQQEEEKSNPEDPGAQENNPMYFTSVNTDRTKKRPRRPTNPKDKANKGLFSKFFGKKDDE